MDYSEVVSDIMGRVRFGHRSGAEISAELLKKLGNPEKDLRIIHVAGTNGKGSVCAYIAATLTATGHRTGLFTSPHLVDYCERIRVDGQEISEDEVIRLFEQIDALGSSPTMFDISFIMAILYFVEKGCEFAVIETGLGGRLDSTNAISKTPEVCVITSIGKDHTEVLGDSIESIAMEKAGIIKPGCGVVLGQMPDRARDLIIEQCRRIGVKTAVGAEVSFSDTFPVKNHATAELALELVGVEPQEYERISRSFRGVPGRMDVISKDPILIVDGAHNPSAAKELVRALKMFYPGKSFVFLIGALHGHDAAGVIKKLASLAEHFFTVGIKDTRAYTADELCDMVTEVAGEGKATACENLEMALLTVQMNAKALDRVAVACGSFYLVGEIFNEVSFAH